MAYEIPTPGLDRWKAMQSRPIGTNTALYRDPAAEEEARAFRRERSDFNRARRLLRNEMSRGGAVGIAATDRLLELNPAAEARGIAFGGVQNAAGTQKTVAGRMASKQQENADLELGRQAQRKGLRDFLSGSKPESAPPAFETPNPTTGMPITRLDFSADDKTPRLDFSADDEIARKRRSLMAAENNAFQTRNWWDR